MTASPPRSALKPSANLLKAIDLDKEAERLREELAGTVSDMKQKKFSKRLKILEAFSESSNRPEWMVLDGACR